MLTQFMVISLILKCACTTFYASVYSFVSKLFFNNVLIHVLLLDFMVWFFLFSFLWRTLYYIAWIYIYSQCIAIFWQPCILTLWGISHLHFRGILDLLIHIKVILANRYRQVFKTWAPMNPHWRCFCLCVSRELAVCNALQDVLFLLLFTHSCKSQRTKALSGFLKTSFFDLSYICDLFHFNC